jgi:hypothetical protein
MVRLLGRVAGGGHVVWHGDAGLLAVEGVAWFGLEILLVV